MNVILCVCMCFKLSSCISWLFVCFVIHQAEHELRLAQTEFDRQAEVTRLLLEGISSTHVSMFAPQTGFLSDTVSQFDVCWGDLWSADHYVWCHPPISGEPLALPAWVCGGTGRLLCTVSQAHAGPSERTEQVGTTKVRFTLIHHASRKLVKNDESALAFYSMLVWRYVAKGLYVHKPCISDAYAFMETAFLVKTITRPSV